MDLRLVKCMLNRSAFEVLYPAIPRDLISPQTMAVIQWEKAYFRTYKEATEVTPDNLIEYIKILKEGQLSDPSVELVIKLIGKLKSVPDPSLPSIKESLLEAKFGGKVAKLVTDYQSGAEVDIITEVADLARDYSNLLGVQVQKTDSIEDILDDLEQHGGVVVDDVPMFNEYFEPFKEGMSICVAGRPDRGKTTLLSFMVTRMARSAVEYFGADRPILWLVNEGHQNRILPRIYQAGLSCTLDELYEYKHEGTLNERYSQAIQAPADYIKVIPIHGKTMGDIEILVQQYNPSVVVTDMVEHIGGVQGGSRTEIVGNTWEKLRTLALIYGYLSIGTAQISAEGGNDLYPDYSNIAWTKTAVQGYTDMILMMGSIEAEGYENIRGLSSPKNKSKVQGKTSYPRKEFVVDFDRCLFMEKNDG